MSEWIPVSERLPEEHVRVLAVVISKMRRNKVNVMFLKLDPGIQIASHSRMFGWITFDFFCHVTHWQPLPPLPESETVDEYHCRKFSVRRKD